MRLLPIIGITLTITGYLVLTFQTFNLNERKSNLLNDINELEKSKTRLTNEAKVKDTIISIQEDIIAQSSDSSTVSRGKELEKVLTDPISNHFTVTNKKNDNIELAQQYESEAFNYLLHKDVNNAIKSFRKSENSFNGFHTVYEIAIFLEKNKIKLSTKNEIIWKQTYSTLLNEFSYKMPKEIKSSFQEIIK
jgi:hypothetical protein